MTSFFLKYQKQCCIVWLKLTNSHANERTVWNHNVWFRVAICLIDYFKLIALKKLCLKMEWISNVYDVRFSACLTFILLSFVTGSITIFYLAKEEEKCRFIPLFPDVFEPITFPFQKGAGQKFCQPSGTGIDLGFFELDDLSLPSPEEDVFPLVICAETTSNFVIVTSR